MRRSERRRRRKGHRRREWWQLIARGPTALLIHFTMPGNPYREKVMAAIREEQRNG